MTFPFFAGLLAEEAEGGPGDVEAHAADDHLQGHQAGGAAQQQPKLIAHAGRGARIKETFNHLSWSAHRRSVSSSASSSTHVLRNIMVSYLSRSIKSAR